MMRRKTILVTGVGGPAGRGTAVLLQQLGYTVIGTDMNPVILSELTCYPVPPATGPQFPEQLAEIARREEAALVIPTVSEELPVLAEIWHSLSNIPVILAPLTAVRIANDKYLTCKTLSQAGVSIPRFILPSQVRSSEEVGLMLGWPCLSKPRVGRGGREVVIRYEPDWPTVAGMDDRYILQEFIPGTDYAVDLYLNVNGEPVAVVVLEKLELKGGLVGNAIRVKRVEAPEVGDLAVVAARIAGLTGPVDVDIRRRVDGTPVILELNARFGGNIHVVPEILEAALGEYLPD
jgi:carbamoylphosphate synthase large subunit